MDVEVSGWQYADDRSKWRSHWQDYKDGWQDGHWEDYKATAMQGKANWSNQQKVQKSTKDTGKDWVTDSGAEGTKSMPSWRTGGWSCVTIFT